MAVKHHFAVRFPDLTEFPRELDEKINVHGLHLKTQKEVQVGEGVAIQFRFPQREDPLRAAGVIAWVSAQPDDQGRRSLVVRNLAFDSEAEELLELVRSTPAPEENVVPGGTAPPPSEPARNEPQTPPPPPPADSPPPQPAPPDPTDVFGEEDEFDEGFAPPPQDKKKLYIGLGVAGVLLVGLLVWLFAFGGTRWIAMTFMAPPEALTVGVRDPAIAGPEPAPPQPKAKPKPRVAPYAVATSFDYFQRPAENEFIITFNRTPRKVITSRSKEPLVQTFYVERARVRLEKEQYFLPFKQVRTVSFEEQDGNLRVSFVSQNPYYLPEPKYEVRGRELVIRFIAQDE